MVCLLQYLYEVCKERINYIIKDVGEAYALFVPEQECDPVTVLLFINLTLPQ